MREHASLLGQGRWGALFVFGLALMYATPASAQAIASGESREAALTCMTQAIVYEAATEPVEGQQAVAQVILNRTRNPRFPASVCGVVYQGAERSTGCQFTFTCDGSLRRRPPASYFAAARLVAEAAMDGTLPDRVGSAINYHAYYVAPRWAPQLERVARIGAHIFYRGPGADAGRAYLSMAAGTTQRPAGVSPVTVAARPFSPWGLPLATSAARTE